jgi:hypothetical protein
MAVRPDSQEDEVEPGPTRKARESQRTDLARVTRRRNGRRAKLSPQSVDVATGDRYVSEQCAAGHSVVTFRILGRDASLVSKEHLRGVPWQLVPVSMRQEPVETFRSSSTGKHEGEHPVGANGLTGHPRDTARQGGGRRRQGREHAQLAV